ncbi:MAG: chromosome segregation protein SMC [Acidiferrobacteraceae bacterium]|nr:chromosome segregation protein SMC [Acidiferrobacteraceae bacterium]
MRLNKIHVAGFKSFVDPTSIHISGSVIGIVGPNGCGKSNVIDAVRWVMGESSARNLRGDSMADVIFNGSGSRKPVGRASVELIFDNNEGRAPGNYAAFSEISVKRKLSRDGASEYFINNTRCRRRDITDMFRGTGLGHRSYSIIEQGMVGRIVEARPEDLRAFVEEAAGVSKYKDRRRETETRIRHTRENLDRVEDIRTELASQLRKLQRQSQAARRYQKLKEEERLVIGELLAVRYLSQKKVIDEQRKITTAATADVDRHMARQREVESSIEKCRADQSTIQENINVAQGDIYSLGADIATVEQNIEHSKETEHQQRGELERLESSLLELKTQKTIDDEELASLEKSLTAHRESRASQVKSLTSSEQQLGSYESELDNWQHMWDTFTERASEPARQQEVERNRIIQLDSQDMNLQERLARLDEEEQSLLEEEESLDIDAARANVDKQLQALQFCAIRIQEQSRTADRSRQTIDTVREQLDKERQSLHEVSGKLASFAALQKAALTSDDERYHDWLDSRGLSDAPRLAQEVRVSSGWEIAADVMLGNRLAGVIVETVDALTSSDHQFLAPNLFLIQSSIANDEEAFSDDSILNYVYSERCDLRSLLTGVYVASNLEQALLRRSSLKHSECVVTRDGIVVGQNWLRTPEDQSATHGILTRGELIDNLSSDKDRLSSDINKQQKELVCAEEENQLAITRQRAQQEESDRLQEDLAAVRQSLAAKEARVAQIQTRSNQLRVESDELIQTLTRIGSEVAEARRNLSLAEDETGSLEEERDKLLQDRDELTKALVRARHDVHEQRNTLHKAELEIQGINVSLDSTRITINRLEIQSTRLEERQEELKNQLLQEIQPDQNYEEQLQQLLETRGEAEVHLNSIKTIYSNGEESLRRKSAELSECERQMTIARDELEAHRLVEKEHSVRFESLNEQIVSEKYSIDDILANLDSEASEDKWIEKSERLAHKIGQIGPVNLVAIDEFEEQLKRKEYLDSQHSDLVEALGTLESVIKKIDIETRERFRETFDLLNSGFGEFFPQLFGGGSAVLELTEGDLLKSGVTVMARPPGKRNSNIHLLSGGEKALTAVALLFALFRLNPAPFCILDEVDAPLDDSNVERYCSTLRFLSDKTQLLVITHNKITMESADILLGVTMGEPGVSAIVSVNIDQAVGMATN